MLGSKPEETPIVVSRKKKKKTKKEYVAQADLPIEIPAI